eukprot:c8661_g1_i2.p1 GENE.c8661_g1_i2~~c8661_g1_i2.p1  ORF type:complete len:382 (+),score=88.36 c8661_g1_i2:34-1179(+)
MPRLVERGRTEDVSQTETTFGDLMIPQFIVRALNEVGLTNPSPIQLQALPPARFGADIIAQAKSGTGKTLTFAIPAVELITRTANALQVLILAPTREIAVQIDQVISCVSKYSTFEIGCRVFIGGTTVLDDKKNIPNTRIAVGTPGRVRQLIEEGTLNTDHIRLFVLDEADKLLSDSFNDDIRWIFSRLPMRKQMIAASATFSEEQTETVQRMMSHPITVQLCTQTVSLKGVKQFYHIIEPHETRTQRLLSLLSNVDFVQTIVFTNDRTLGRSLVNALTAAQWPTAIISGDCEQSHRNSVMQKLRKFQIRVLVSTDLTARGIDVENVNFVVNLDLPRDWDTYFHRIGRTGRFGTFCSFHFTSHNEHIFRKSWCCRHVYRSS